MVSTIGRLFAASAGYIPFMASTAWQTKTLAQIVDDEIDRLALADALKKGNIAAEAIIKEANQFTNFTESTDHVEHTENAENNALAIFLSDINVQRKLLKGLMSGSLKDQAVLKAIAKCTFFHKVDQLNDKKWTARFQHMIDHLQEQNQPETIIAFAFLSSDLTSLEQIQLANALNNALSSSTYIDDVVIHSLLRCLEKFTERGAKITIARTLAQYSYALHDARFHTFVFNLFSEFNQNQNQNEQTALEKILVKKFLNIFTTEIHLIDLLISNSSFKELFSHLMSLLSQDEMEEVADVILNILKNNLNIYSNNNFSKIVSDIASLLNGIKKVTFLIELEKLNIPICFL